MARVVALRVVSESCGHVMGTPRYCHLCHDCGLWWSERVTHPNNLLKETEIKEACSTPRPYNSDKEENMWILRVKWDIRFCPVEKRSQPWERYLISITTMSYGIPSVTGLVLLVSTVSVVALDVIWHRVRTRRERKGSPLPPGPTPIPLLGNALSVDIEEPWKTYTTWKAAYGETLYVRLLDHECVILNSQSDAVELLEKRSRIYSDRPFIATAVPYGMGCNFALERYGDHWRLCRRIFHQTFRADAALTFRPMQLRRARQMIVNIIDDPNQYASHYSTFSAAVAMSAAYDYEPDPRNDPIVHIVDKFLQASIPAITAEKAHLLKIFPFLLQIPDWLPGSSLKRNARISYGWAVKMVETPYQYVQKQMEASRHPTLSMVSDHITRMQKYDEPYRSDYTSALKHASATAFLGAFLLTHGAVVYPYRVEQAQQGRRAPQSWLLLSPW
ncbi:hypothetical protein PAXRUDRAFT_239039 [Paxillus rubicundulus Ve08.2h10]|uniref:Unplaced genomic scaffold scaffold_121, whole genome shotgun sequence n=1 Tax=Paxillus rubicundulus Ve08.2h10 TaxID=930991 RepID=A0A0D0E108_9AGAM|nr:hypothetical protein PAXRUDRAFT_239039 [Paxillus rubicundulus Ve08.2h10]